MTPYNLTVTFDNIKQISQMFLDIFIMWLLIYYGIKLIRNNSRTIQIFKGVLFVIVVDILAKFLGLNTVGFIADMFVNWGILAIIILFQPELRSILERMGKSGMFSRFNTLSGNEKEHLVDEIVTSTMLLSKNQTGALISIEQSHSLSDYIKTGIQVNSDVSAELLTSIFVTTTPLHDGAVIIQGDKIACASAYFPPTNLELPSRYGARHRAAIGISEITDSVTIVVSEETGGISIAQGGQIFSVNRKQLRDYLMRVICNATTEVKDMLVDDDVQKAKIDKQNVKNNDSDKTDTTVLSKLSIKKQSENVSEKIEAEEIVSDGKVTMSKDTVEEKPKVTTSTQKKKSKGLFAKKDKNVTTKSINLKKDDYDAILDKEEQSIKLPQKKEKPVLKDYEEDIVKRHNPSLDKPNVDTQSKVVKEDEMKKEVEPKAVSQKPNKVEKPYTATYVSSTNVRVMGIDPTKETLDPVKHEEKVLPKVENVEKKVFEKPAVSESKPIDFDTDKIDVSKLMGYDSELDKTFDILDKNYHGKGGNE